MQEIQAVAHFRFGPGRFQPVKNWAEGREKVGIAIKVGVFTSMTPADRFAK